MQYVLGLDGGGTKTEMFVADILGNELQVVRGGASNPKSVPFETAMLHISEILNSLYAEGLFEPGLCQGICVGMAGIYIEEEKARVVEHLSQYYTQRGVQLPLIQITNDAEIALMAGLGENCGIIAIAGTGSIVYGMTPSGQSFRTGGWGHLLGDQGSGYDIGLQTLQTVMLSFDGVLPPTFLTELILAKYQFQSPAELRSYVYLPHIDKGHIADFAELCITAADNGDRAALDIMTKAAEDLAKLTEAIRRKDEWFEHSTIAVTGSIFKYSRLFGERYKERLASAEANVTIVTSERTPAHGAALLAARAWKRNEGQ